MYSRPKAVVTVVVVVESLALSRCELLVGVPLAPLGVAAVVVMVLMVNLSSTVPGRETTSVENCNTPRIVRFVRTPHSTAPCGLLALIEAVTVNSCRSADGR